MVQTQNLRLSPRCHCSRPSIIYRAVIFLSQFWPARELQHTWPFIFCFMLLL